MDEAQSPGFAEPIKAEIRTHGPNALFGISADSPGGLPSMGGPIPSSSDGGGDGSAPGSPTLDELVMPSTIGNGKESGLPGEIDTPSTTNSTMPRFGGGKVSTVRLLKCLPLRIRSCQVETRKQPEIGITNTTNSEPPADLKAPVDPTLGLVQCGITRER